ncbi:Hypp4771 [Branchiostoma lanceolatum]|uniref:Hypp4771 protein n=1 Tax=Branchiostoma lanceolatum TaxID=7740 RepID=A0A8K0EZT9_BRALA|nr:Hypp4771 [Branchiostoma lanceolatum]
MHFDLKVPSLSVSEQCQPARKDKMASSKAVLRFSVKFSDMYSTRHPFQDMAGKEPSPCCCPSKRQSKTQAIESSGTNSLSEEPVGRLSIRIGLTSTGTTQTRGLSQQSQVDM